MCGRYGFGNPNNFGSLNLGVAFTDLAPRYNVAPSQVVPLLVVDEGERQAFAARWGLVPFWANDPSIGNRLVNARGETVRDKPSFRSAFRMRRGLLPADLFYEWQTVPGSKTRVPWCIRHRDNSPFAFAALWERWRDKSTPDAAPLVTCTIVTTTPNELMAPIHDRMPVILEPQDFDAWLNPKTNLDEAAALIRPCDPAPWHAYRVSTVVNAPVNDVEACTDPITD